MKEEAEEEEEEEEEEGDYYCLLHSMTLAFLRSMHSLAVVEL